MRLEFSKEVGEHRGAPRLFFQEVTRLQDGGFTPGTRYDIVLWGANELHLIARPDGKRAVCRKVVGASEKAVIDLNGKAAMERFEGWRTVRVTITPGKVRIQPEDHW